MLNIVRRMTLRQRLVALVAVAFVPAIAGLGYFIATFHQQRERDVHEEALRTSQIVALEMERIVTGAEAVLETLAFAPPVRTLSANCPEYLAEIVAELPQFSGFAVADRQGQVRCAAGVVTGDDVARASWFAAALRDGRPAVGEYVGGRMDLPAYLPVAKRRGADAQSTVLVAGIDLDWLGARMRDRRLPPGGVLAIADRNGALLAREPSPERYLGTKVSAQVLPLVNARRPGTAEVVEEDGQRRIIGFQPPAATGTGLYVGVGLSTADAFAPVYASTWRSLAVALAGAAAACLVAWTVGDRLFRHPIHRILATIASWRAGDEKARTGIAVDGSELSVLAASIDGYMDSLAAAHADREAAEERRELLLREMNHRIKNVLAAVQAIANQTFKGRATPESLKTFGSRLRAMAATHDLLVTENWESADLRETLAAALDPFGSDVRRRFNLEGPPVEVTAKAALALSLALHELCTNAAKYGALTTPEGEVSLRWRLAAGENGDRLQLFWTERRGPPVAPPEHAGFGTRLIRTALASELGATADLVFAEAGVEFVLDADAAVVLAGRSVRGTAA
jgi:two-component sensor histidine kinase